MYENDFGRLYDKLPKEAQIKAINYLTGLVEKYSSAKTISLKKLSRITDDPCIGMWKDKTDIKDSIEYVKKIRRDNWKK